MNRYELNLAITQAYNSMNYAQSQCEYDAYRMQYEELCAKRDKQ